MLNTVLTDMGMSVAFDKFLADFSNMVTDMALLPGNLYIDFVKHKTFVQVDETGTEAAAVTVVGIGVTSIIEPTMFVNRPFVFAIRERENGMILFLGKVVDPVWQE
jgi:serpin B